MTDNSRISLKEELIILLNKCIESDGYENPYFVSALLVALEESYGYTDDTLDAWNDSLWSR